MNQQSVQPPIARDSITLTLSPDEAAMLLDAVQFYCQLFEIYSQLFETNPDLPPHPDLQLYKRLCAKIKFLSPDFQSGDACRHLVQSPDAVGQGGNQ